MLHLVCSLTEITVLISEFSINTQGLQHASRECNHRNTPWIHDSLALTGYLDRRSGLERLEKIAGQPHLSRRVRRFNYMVPFFYVEGHISLIAC
jgi:hypothetical protein